jgi:uncharacterized protein YegP (UPF0339 family)
MSSVLKRRSDSNASYNITGFRSMDGDSKPYFRRHRNDFPQNTQLFDWYLSHHHWHTGYYRLLQQVITSRGRNKVDAKFQIYKDAAGEFRFKLVDVNGQTIAVSDGYTTRKNALEGIKSVKQKASMTVIEDTIV